MVSWHSVDLALFKSSRWQGNVGVPSKERHSVQRNIAYDWFKGSGRSLYGVHKQCERGHGTKSKANANLGQHVEQRARVVELLEVQTGLDNYEGVERCKLQRLDVAALRSDNL